MKNKIELTKKQKRDGKMMNRIYNSGKMKEAYEFALKLYNQNQRDLFCKYSYATMAGDYSYHKSLNKKEKNKLFNLAKRLLKQVYSDPDLKKYPEPLVNVIKNEYYFFHKLHKKQYEHGKKNYEKGYKGSSYSMCVGACELALEYSKKSKRWLAMHWAKKSIEGFKKYEKVNPNWYNINYFAADAYAILGNEKKAISIFEDMYRKQNRPIDKDEVKSFKTKIEKYKKL